MSRSPTPTVPGSAPGEPVTLRQVAEVTGFSIASVSCAFNGKAKVSEANRAIILAAAEKLGYRPNLLVRAMQSGVSGNVGVVVWPYGEFTTALTNGITLRLAEAGLTPILHWATVASGTGPEEELQAEREALDRLLQHRVDGIILSPLRDDVLQYHFNEVWRRGLPLVSIDRVMPKVTCDSVSTDDALGGRLAAEHLLALGHRQVAQLAGELRFGSYHRRAEAFATAIVAAGGTCKTIEIANKDHPRLVEVARQVLDAPRPSAVFLGSDVFAPAIYRVAQDLALDIPRDLSVVGYAGLSQGGFLQPRLTTIQQDATAIGRRAAELLLTGIGDSGRRGPPRSEVLAPGLNLRESTGPRTVKGGRRG